MPASAASRSPWGRVSSSYRGQRGLRIQLIGQFWLASQQSLSGDQGKQLRLLVPSGGCHKLLDLPRDRGQGAG